MFATRAYPSPPAAYEDTDTSRRPAERTSEHPPARPVPIGPTDGRPAGEAAPRVIPAMGLPNRAPGVAVMGGPDQSARVDVMGVPADGQGPDVMGGPDWGPRLDIMGESDPRFVDFLFTGRTNSHVGH